MQLVVTLCLGKWKTRESVGLGETVQMKALILWQAVPLLIRMRSGLSQAICGIFSPFLLSHLQTHTNLYWKQFFCTLCDMRYEKATVPVQIWFTITLPKRAYVQKRSVNWPDDLQYPLVKLLLKILSWDTGQPVRHHLRYTNHDNAPY